MPKTVLPIPLLSLLSLPLVAQVDETTEPVELETIVVTATGEERNKNDLPDTIHSFDEATIEAISPSHPSEVLNRAAGVYVNNLGGEGHMTAIRQPITTRGVYLYLEDGIPVRPTGFFNHNALYEVNIPQSGFLEITKGPGSALYGSDAIGGVINSLSRRPPGMSEGRVNIELGSYGWQRALLSAGTRYNKHRVNVNVNITDNEGYRDAADYSRESLTSRWDIDATQDLAIKTLLSYTQVDQSGVSSLEESDYRNNTTKNRFQGDTGFRDVEALRLSSEFSLSIGHDRLLTMTPYFRDNTTKMAPSWMVSYDPNERESTFQSFGLLSRYRIQASDQLLWIVGLDIDYTPSEYTEEAISHNDNAQGIYTGYTRLGHKNYDFEAEQSSVSPYLHMEFQLTDKLLASLGLRYDDFHIDYDNQLETHATSPVNPQLGRPVNHLNPEDQSVNFDAFSPKLGFVYTISPNYNTYANYRQAFSIPSVTTLFRSGSTQNSDQLQPIKAESYELGLRGYPNDHLNFEATLYHMQVRDDLVSVITESGRNIFNAGETEHQGIELALNGILTDELSYALALTKTWQTYQEFSYTSGRSGNVDVSNNDVGKAPDTIGNFTLAYSPTSIPDLRVELEWEHLGEYYTDETNTQTYDGHDLFNLRTNYWVNDHLEVYARIQNLSDELYSTYTSNQVNNPNISYRPGLPRAFFGGFKLSF